MSATKSHEDLIIGVLALANAITREGYRVLAPARLSPAQFNMLNLLDLYPNGLTQQEMAAAIVTDAGGTSRMLKKMGAYIQKSRHPNKPHAWVLTLTDEGKKLHGMAKELYLSSLNKRLGKMSAADAKRLAEELTGCRAMVGQWGVSP